MPRIRFSAAGLVLAAATGGVFADTVIYSTSFEAPSFNVGNLAAPLAPGQGGWRIDYDDPAQARIVSGGARTGAQSVRMTADPADASGGWAWWDPLEINPIAAGTPLVTIEYGMYLGTATPASAGWGVEVFSPNLVTMGGMQVGINNRIQVDNGGVWTDTGASANRGNWNSYKLVFDFLASRYDAYYNNNLIADNFVFDKDNGLIGDVDLRHYQPDAAGDMALFDDFSVTTGGQLPSGAEWNVDSSGDWNVGANWSTGFVPNGTSISAKFGPRITATRQINLTSQITLDQLQITSPQSYIVSGNPVPGSYGIRFAGPLSLPLQVSAGSHEFQTPVRIEKDATIGVGPGATLRFSNTFDVAGRNIIKSGEGTLLVSQIRANTLTIDTGTMRLIGSGSFSGPSAMGILTINNGSLDLNGHDLVVDYTAGSPAGAIRQYLFTGKLYDSTTSNVQLGIGFADNSILGLTQLEGLPVDDTAVIVRLTIKGDGNLDGTVNIDDFSLLGTNFNRQGLWYNGDFNYNGVVELGDFALLATYFNQSAPPTLLASVAGIPEPTAAGALFLGSMALFRRTRRQKPA